MLVNLNNAHWVHQLPHQFYRQKLRPQKTLSPTIKLAESLDLAIRTSLSTILAGVSIPAGYTGEKIARDIQVAEQADQLDPFDQRFYGRRRHTSFHRGRARRPLTVQKGVFEKLWWQTAYQPQQDYLQHERNELAVAYYWRHGDKPRPTVILVHGFVAAGWSVNEFFLGMSYLFNLGCDIVLKTLPHHGERQRPGNLISGLDYVSGGIQSLNHAVVQSTYDIRALVDFLERECRVESIGLSGLSLGGYTSALMAGLEQRFKFVMPVIPIVSIPDAMMEWKPLNQKLEHIMQEFALDMPQLRQTMAFHSPLTRKALLPPERLMIIAGIGDKMATPKHAKLLQQHWDGCHLHWFGGSHVMPLEKAGTNKAKNHFLREIGFIK